MDAAIHLASLVWCLVTVGWILPAAMADLRVGVAISTHLHCPQSCSTVSDWFSDSDVVDLVASRDLARQLTTALPFEGILNAEIAPRFADEPSAPLFFELRRLS